MKVSEVIAESEEHAVNNVLINRTSSMLVALQAEGIEKISTRQLLRSLHKIGFKLSMDHLVGVLEELPNVSAVSKNSIYLGDISSGYQDIESEKGKEDVGKAAQKQAKKRVKEE